MITIKKAHRFEKSIWVKLTKTIFDHKILSFLAVTSILLFTAITLSITLMLSLVGAVQVETKWIEMHDSGEITDSAYSVLQMVITLVAIGFNYLGYVVVILVTIPILIFVYWIYKRYLQYKHDNL